MRIPILGRKDMYIHLDVTRGVSVDHTEIGGAPMQSLKLFQLGWHCASSGASGSVVTGVGGSPSTPPVQPQVEEPEAPVSETPIEETPEETATPVEEVVTPEPESASSVDPEDDLPEPEDGGWYT